MCSLGITVGAKLVCPRCNANFASYAFQSAVQFEQFCPQNTMKGIATRGAHHVPSTPIMTSTSFMSTIDTQIFDCVVDPVPYYNCKQKYKYPQIQVLLLQ